MDTTMNVAAIPEASVVQDQPNNSNKTTATTTSTKKRKRASSSACPPPPPLAEAEREARVHGLRAELDALFRYFREVSDGSLVSDSFSSPPSPHCGLNSAIACLIEESDKPLSCLVDQVYEKVKCWGESVTMASVKGSVLMIGQRSSYGLPNVHADLLEDQSVSCLWCWETRDMKMMPRSIRGVLKIRRTCRKKIHERITAVSALLAVLQGPESHQNSTHDLMKASDKLSKVLDESAIRTLVESMVQKNGVHMAEKDVKREEKALIKQLEKNKREAEKEKMRLDLELKKEKLCSEKELRRLQDDSEKAARRREKEESDLRRQQRRQQEEAEKEQRRREKEEAGLKKQLSILKQASIMERFLKKNNDISSHANDKPAKKALTPDSVTNKREEVLEPVTQSMDSALLLKGDLGSKDLRSSLITSWRSIGRHVCLNGKRGWGMRQKPKTSLMKDLKLATRGGHNHDDELSTAKLSNEWEDIDEKSCHISAGRFHPCSQKYKRSKQLLQFDKSNRPAFYGIWPRKSQTVGARNPFKKDPELDYDVDSDEEWEEEDPGESLSDCDKDDQEELEGSSKLDGEDESEDGFFVPDGYLSEDEGVQIDSTNSDQLVDQKSLSSCQQEFEGEDLCRLFKQQKYLHDLTERALRKNQPLIILNLMHEKMPLSMAEDLSGTAKVEQMCLEALSMRPYPAGAPIEISLNNNVISEDKEAFSPNSKGCSTPVATVAALPECDLRQIVSAIQSSSQSMNKAVESLQQLFPSAPKTQLRSKVRELSNFVDNCWQVKKDVLDKLGLPVSPEISAGGRTRSIASYYSKRCLPPAGEDINSTETSPSPFERQLQDSMHI